MATWSKIHSQPANSQAFDFVTSFAGKFGYVYGNPFDSQLHFDAFDGTSWVDSPVPGITWHGGYYAVPHPAISDDGLTLISFGNRTLPTLEYDTSNMVNFTATGALKIGSLITVQRFFGGSAHAVNFDASPFTLYRRGIFGSWAFVSTNLEAAIPVGATVAFGLLLVITHNPPKIYQWDGTSWLIRWDPIAAGAFTDAQGLKCITYDSQTNTVFLATSSGIFQNTPGNVTTRVFGAGATFAQVKRLAKAPYVVAGPQPEDIFAITAGYPGDGLLWALYPTGTGEVFSSPDGVTWTDQGAPPYSQVLFSTYQALGVDTQVPPSPPPAGVTDYQVSARFFKQSGQSFANNNGVALRVATGPNAYVAMILPGTGGPWLVIDKVVGGVLTELARSAAIPIPLDGYTLQLGITGSALNAKYWDGVVVRDLSVTDSSITSAGAAGLYSAGLVADMTTWRQYSPGGAIIASDDFARPDGALGSNWTQVGGNWAIVSQKTRPDVASTAVKWGGVVIPPSSVPVGGSGSGSSGGGFGSSGRSVPGAAPSDSGVGLGMAPGAGPKPEHFVIIPRPTLPPGPLPNPRPGNKYPLE
jgi:hypothetical protein